MPALSRLSLAALALPLLSGCGGGGEQFPPVCPRPAILRDAADLSRYRGTGRDITDSILEGRITGIVRQLQAGRAEHRGGDDRGRDRR